MNIRRWQGLTALGVLSTLLIFARTLSGEEHEHQSSMQMCQKMMAERQQTQAEFKAVNEELRNLVQKMNHTTAESEKISVMQDLLSKIVENHAGMQERMMGIMPMMIQHMSQHMGMDTESNQKKMSECPMMGGSGAPSEGSGTEGHSHQH